MRNSRKRINQIGRQIKKLKNRARTANRQKKWAEERKWLERIQALNIERKQLQGQVLETRSLGAEVSPRILKKINVLLNEIARDKRILEAHKASNNIPGVKKYEKIVQSQQAKLARLQGRQQNPPQPGVNNNRKIRILLNELGRDRKILERHRQANNAPGVKKYEKIVKNQLAELQRLRGQNQGPGGSGASGSSGGSSAPPASGGSPGDVIKKIAIEFRDSTSHRRIDIAHNAIFAELLKDPRFQGLPSRNGKPWPLHRIIGNTEPPPANSIIDQPFILDAVNISKSNITLDGYTVTDGIFQTDFVKEFDKIVKTINNFNGNPADRILPSFKGVAHRDAFQLIPQDSNISRNWSQYAGAKLHDVTLKNIKIQSPGSLQGIFSSDGAYDNLNFKNIKVDTQSAHGITILGYLSGMVDLSNDDGSETKIELRPLRLGGGTNIYVIGFSANSSYQYGAVTASPNVKLVDNRQVKKEPIPRNTNYTNFDMDNFIGLIRAGTINNPDIKFDAFIKLIKESAERSGDEVT